MLRCGTGGATIPINDSIAIDEYDGCGVHRSRIEPAMEEAKGRSLRQDLFINQLMQCGEALWNSAKEQLILTIIRTYLQIEVHNIKEEEIEPI